MEFYRSIKEKLNEIVIKNDLMDEAVKITTRVLKPIEAIGETERKDYPLLKGKEFLINAELKGCIGQAFTDEPTDYSGSIKDVMSLDLESNRNKAIFIASLNAIFRYLDIIDKTVHCKNEQPEICAKKIKEYIKDKYGDVKIGLIGFQPAILDNIRTEFSVRVLDLDTDNIGKEKYGVVVEDGSIAFKDVIEWADMILATGSTIGNGTIVNFLNLDKPVLFFGTTIAGVAQIKGLDRVCFCAE
jgi:putative heavy-metal chelation protein